MLAMLLLAWIAAHEPFPVAVGGNADLRRLHDAWLSEATSTDQRAAMDARLRAAAAQPDPDWQAVAFDYFEWRNAVAAEADIRRAWGAYMNAWEVAREAARPSVCITETRTEEGLFSVTRSTSVTTCEP